MKPDQSSTTSRLPPGGALPGTRDSVAGCGRGSGSANSRLADFSSIRGHGALADRHGFSVLRCRTVVPPRSHPAKASSWIQRPKNDCAVWLVCWYTSALHKYTQDRQDHRGICYPSPLPLSAPGVESTSWVSLGALTYGGRSGSSQGT